MVLGCDCPVVCAKPRELIQERNRLGASRVVAGPGKVSNACFNGLDFGFQGREKLLRLGFNRDQAPLPKLSLVNITDLSGTIRAGRPVSSWRATATKKLGEVELVRKARP